MGKGDKKTRKGKIIMGSYGVTRPQRKFNKVSENPDYAEKGVQNNSKNKPKPARKAKEE